MAIVIPELKLLKIIEVLNKHYFDDYQANLATPTESLLYNMFGGLVIDEFDFFENFIKLLENHFKEHEKPMTVNLGWSPERAKYPSVSLLLPNEEVIAEGVNIVVEQVETDNGKWREEKRYPYNVTYALLIGSENANEVMLLYHYYKTILIAGIEQLELREFSKIRISGKDHTMQMDILPQQAHFRTVDITFLYTNQVWGIHEQDVAGNITFNSNNQTTPPQLCLPAEISLNDISFPDILSGDSVNIDVEDTDGNEVGAKIAGKWIVPAAGVIYASAPLMQTGQVSSDRSGDDGDTQRGRNHTTLTGNNPFGNTARYTDSVGTQVYANDIVTDWSTLDPFADIVLLIYRVIQTGKDWDDHIDDPQTMTIGGLATWFLINEAEISNLVRREGGNETNYLNFAPFNITITAQGERIFTSSKGDIPTRALALTENGSLTNNTKTTFANGLIVRPTPLTELGF